MSIINRWALSLRERWQEMFRSSMVEENVLSGLDLNLDDIYDDPNIAIEIQDRYMDNTKRLDILRPKYKKYVEYVSVLQRIEMLPNQIKKQLEKLCQVYSETLIQKSEFREQIQQQQGTEGQHSYLEQYEGSITDIIAMMRGHEENQRLVKQDLAYLESERAELNYQQGRLNTAYRFISGAIIALAAFSAAAALVLSILFFVYDRPILLAAMISMVAVIVGTVWVYVFRRYLLFEIKKNQKLIKRAVELTNKTKIKFINNQKVIDYQCKKYRVDSSEMLELRWQNYKDRISARNQYRNISNSIAAMITDIENLLRKNGIEDDGMVLDHMDYFVSKQGRKILMNKLVERRDELKKEYDQTDKENNLINLVLTNYKSNTNRGKL